MDHLDDDIGGNASLHGGEIERGVDRRPCPVLVRDQLLHGVVRREVSAGIACDRQIVFDAR